MYNQKVTLKNSIISVSFIASEKKFLSPFLNFALAKGLETNKESSPYTKIEIKLHKTFLHSFVAE